jgi:hypothetical protein
MNAGSVPIAPALESRPSAVGSDSAPVDRDVPTVLVAQSTPDLRRARQALIAYCENAEYSPGIRIRVLGKYPYATSPGDFRAAFVSDLQQAHLVVQILGETYSDRSPEFPEGIEGWQVGAARDRQVPLVQWCDSSVMVNQVDEESHRQLLSDPEVLRDQQAVFQASVVEQARRAFKMRYVQRDDEPERLVVVKYNDADADAAREVVDTLGRHNLTCLSSNNGLPLVAALRELPVQALIVVLGNCPQDWVALCGLELLKVQITFKDRTPLRVYFNTNPERRIPPLTGKGVLEVRGQRELNQLVEAIRGAAK